MKAKTLRNIYVIVTLLISIPLSVELLKLLDIEFRWWIGLISFLFFTILGKFLYTYFSGINFRNVIFHDNLDEDGYTLFNLRAMFGFSREILIIGRFKNDLDLNEENLSKIIYSQLTKHRLLKTNSDGISRVEFNVNGEVLEIEFQNTGLALPSIKRYRRR